MIFFDLDGTLLDHKSSEYLAVKAFYKEYRDFFSIEEEPFYDLWYKVSDKYFQRYLNGELTFTQQRVERIREIFSISGTIITDEVAEIRFKTYLQNYVENWKPFDDVIPCLEELHKYRLGIISNGDLEQQMLKLERMGIKDYFEVFVTAGDTGVAKPNPRIFKIACMRAGEEPMQCYYVGDDLKTDILPCNNFGMTGIWINRKMEPIELLNTKTIFSLLELKTVL